MLSSFKAGVVVLLFSSARYRSPSYVRCRWIARERAGALFGHGWKTNFCQELKLKLKLKLNVFNLS